MPSLILTPREIHIIVQLIKVMIDDDLAFEYAKPVELERIKTKLQNVKD